MSEHFKLEAAPPTSENKFQPSLFNLSLLTRSVDIDVSTLTTVCQCVSADTLGCCVQRVATGPTTLLWFRLVFKQLQHSVIQIHFFSILLYPPPFPHVPLPPSIHSSRCYCLMDGKRFLCRAPDWPQGSRTVFGRRPCAACPRSQD